MNRPPNILFLMSDEHRFDVAGYAGDDVVHTPTLDELARDAAVFTGAYTPAPICIPARQSMMAGQFPRTTGCERFGEDLAPGHLTFAGQLAEHGYETVVAGKTHHTGTDQSLGWTHRIGTVGFPRRGTSTTAKGRGRQKWSTVKEVKRAAAGRGDGSDHDDYAVLGAVNHLDKKFVDAYHDRENPDQPILLKVSLIEPHYPFLAEHPDRFAYYLPRVRTFAGDKPFDHPFLGGGNHRVVAGEDADEREIRRATAAYYAMVETMDARLGRVLDKLRHIGQDLDEWIIVYTTDHGEMMGEHGMFEKQKFFEASARVPLIIRWPAGLGRGQRVIDRNVSLCDLFATLCDLTGTPVPDGLDSRSLAPLLRGEEGAEEAWDDEAVSQFQGKHLMIKRGALKYQWYGVDMPEVLFDLEADPGETVCVLDRPEHAAAVADFRRRRDELGFDPDKDPDPHRPLWGNR